MSSRKTISNIEWKLRETDFFLTKMQEIEEHKVHPYDFLAYNFYFNSFTVAARSVTLAIQYVMCEYSDFYEWYSRWQEKLKQNPLARKLLEYRNDILHKGDFFVRSGVMKRTENGVRSKHYFDCDQSLVEGNDDIFTLSRNHLGLLVHLVKDLQMRFGRDVDLLDPDQFYTIPNLARKGFSIEDIEEGLGYSRGWTHTEGCTQEDRLQILLNEIPKPQLSDLYAKYL